MLQVLQHARAKFLAGDMMQEPKPAFQLVDDSCLCNLWEFFPACEPVSIVDGKLNYHVIDAITSAYS